ncbi:MULTISPECIES: hypothetical protein [Streptomyces]|uniref:hypothetical protein n=1 Tax=Streptomyces TaxID=1883 RepID=UPI001E5EE589|nr:MULTISPECIES: hypothetical protein [Streptomyces]UFQ16441.1 hypothetical protein J2N69_16310 [Streptomyces huasconensis]WCL86043.1 hypothetical protein PPN52_16320 [Streptomyces sp. JCM 35825]
MTAWIMALAEHSRPDVPNYAEDVHPLTARASVVADDFADLFVIFKGWREQFGDTITTYAMPFEEGEDWSTEWTELGPTYRLDHIPGGWIQVSPDYEAEPKGRPPFAQPLDDGTAPAVEGA